MTGLLLAACLALPPTAVSAAARRPADDTLAATFRREVGFLASDALAGRQRGTEGGFAAAGYLVSELRRAGLQPFEGAYRHEFGRTQFKKKLGPAQWGYTQPPTRMQNIYAITRPPREGEKVIVVGAHYDHVGSGLKGGTRGPRGLVNNGADDNASGTVVALEVARAIMRRPLPSDARPVLVAFFDGEEAGLLGSQFLAKQYPRRFAAMVNLDMVGAMKNNTVYVYGDATCSVFDKLPQLPEAAGLDLRLLQEHCVRSDHAPFFFRSVPYLFFHTGLHPRYHMPADDADLLNYDGLVRIAKLTEAVVRDLATSDNPLTFDKAANDLPTVPSPPWQP